MNNTAEQHRYFIINKPYNMVSQFISSHDVRLLGHLSFDFPEGTHAIGRLDNHSEGLLILTTNKKVTRLLFDPKKKHERTYLVMVNRVVSEELLAEMRAGVSIPVKNGERYFAVPHSIKLVENVKDHYKYMNDSRQQYPHSWLLITLTEGKFHQVRKMSLAVNRRCLRLIRLSIENLQLGDLEPGMVREYSEAEFFKLIGIKYAA
ncbi:MAG: pseudouridine synthase [Chitinophagaceae bacterium]|nr:pseudouridine synthase [Chitinophagaceae bacterium]